MRELAPADMRMQARAVAGRTVGRVDEAELWQRAMHTTGEDALWHKALLRGELERRMRLECMP